MPGFRHIRAVILVASALALATRVTFPVHLWLAGADGVIYVAMCTAAGIKQVPLRKSDGGDNAPGHTGAGCAHSLCAASVPVGHGALVDGCDVQYPPLVHSPGDVTRVHQAAFAPARGPPSGALSIAA